MSLKSLSKELLDSISARADHQKLETIARAIYREAVHNGKTTETPPLNSTFASKEDYDRWTGKLNPIQVHGYSLPQRFAPYASKLTPAEARQIAGCRYTPDGRVAFWP